nr:peroxiredoxin [uncultured Gellertiella sp.]
MSADHSPPDIGAVAPDFDLPRDGGTRISLTHFAGKPVVLFFYPKDNTPGCTSEAIAFSALADAFSKAGAAVIGLSADNVKSHERFIRKHALSVPLASDEDQETLKTYGVWKQKSMFGKSYMGIERTTFLIDGNGRIARIWNKVSVDGHAQEVLAAVRSL